ncbi:hypothetical protein [Streptomyces sediminimaris]|uniref:hypothetical protein n=1 Tax=Streptomyces sediminimaris TaxID=3383721 RepID=UPI00399A0B29
MALSPDADRHGVPRCGGKKKQGEGTCTQPAGWGTDHAGVGRCKLHGGCTPNQAVSAGRQKAEAEARRVLAELSVGPVADPLEALLKLAGEVLAWQRATAGLVNQLDSIRYPGGNGTEQLRSEVVLYERAMDRAVNVLAAIARLNIDERLVAVTERQADAVVSAINAALEAAGVSGVEAEAARKAAARHLRSVS